MDDIPNEIDKIKRNEERTIGVAFENERVLEHRPAVQTTLCNGVGKRLEHGDRMTNAVTPDDGTRQGKEQYY